VPHQRVIVAGSTGRIEVMIPFNAPAGEATVIRVDDGRLLGDGGIETIRIEPSDQYGLQGEAFAKAVRGVEPLAWGVADARRMMRILDAIVRAADGGGFVAIN
jgi:predicted dehydrogenase